VNIEIGLFGIGSPRQVGERFAVDDDRPDIALREPKKADPARGRA
jgi:hypothetical protein